MVDIFNETILTIAEASHRLPTKPSLSAIFRWRQRGIRGVKLETALLAGRRVTSREALERFFAAIARTDETIVDSKPTSQGRESQIQRAEKQLDQAGVRNSKSINKRQIGRTNDQ